MLKKEKEESEAISASQLFSISAFTY